jgi:hypothetical protein
MVKTMGGEAAAGGSAPAEEPKVWELRYGPEVSAALGPVTMARARTEAAWGRGTLPALVSPQTAIKFAAAEAKLDAALASMDASAMPPSPHAPRAKNCRRVRRCSSPTHSAGLSTMRGCG